MEWKSQEDVLPYSNLFSSWQEHHEYMRRYLLQQHERQKTNDSLSQYRDWYSPRTGQHSLRYLDLLEGAVNGIGYANVAGPVAAPVFPSSTLLASIAYEAIGYPVLLMPLFDWTVYTHPSVQIYKNGSPVLTAIHSGETFLDQDSYVGNVLYDLWFINSSLPAGTFSDIHFLLQEQRR